MAMVHAHLGKLKPEPVPGQPQLPPAVVVFANTPARAFAKSPFQGLALERESQAGVPKHETDPLLQAIVEAWKKFDVGAEQERDRVYRAALDAISGIRCSAAEFDTFVYALPSFSGDKDFPAKAGYFLSALINCGSDEHYVVRTAPFSEIGLPHFLGFCNQKHVVVDGDIGGGIGYKMQKGSITVIGNAGWLVGAELCGGTLTVTRNAGTNVGCGMRNGIIIIKGNVSTNTGAGMQGGTLIVEGDSLGDIGNDMSGGEIHFHFARGCGCLSDRIRGGKIFAKGRQIYPRLVQESVSESVPEPNQEVV